MNEVELIERFNERLKREYNEYVESMFKKTPMDIVRSAYELNFKLEISELFIDADLEDYSVGLTEEIILELEKKDNILNYLYKAWMNTDESYMDILRDSMYTVFDELG